MAKEETFAPDEPREFTWAGTTMYRCPFDRCSWSHQDRDAVIDHIFETGHLGPDAEPEPETEETPPQARKGGKS